MPSTHSRDGLSRPKRKSLFNLSSLTQIHPTAKGDKTNSTANSQRLVKRRSTAPPDSIHVPLELIQDEKAEILQPVSSDLSRTSTARSTSQRPSSVFGSLRSLKSFEDARYAADASPDAEVQAPPSRSNVLHHGEAQTSGSMFRKKKEYIVLTETHIVRCKSQHKASEMFSAVPDTHSRGMTLRHSSSTSIGSTYDAQSFESNSSGDKEGRIPLRQVVAVSAQDEGRPYFAIEVCYLDEESNQATSVILQFNLLEERDVWTHAIRAAAHRLRSANLGAIHPNNAKYAARIVEREGDYDPAQFQLYKVILRTVTKTGGRSSTDDLSKISSVIYFLAIGIHKVHLIPLPKGSGRISSPALSQSAHGSYGVLTLSKIHVGTRDDTLELTFRQPLKRPKLLSLASLSSHEIALGIHSVERFLRPECVHPTYTMKVPPEVQQQLISYDASIEDHCAIDRTLAAYCIAYDVNPAKISYAINYECEDAPRFELYPVAETRRKNYHALELLAVLRALRYNESFASISFAGICLDSLHALTDEHGNDFVCDRTKTGVPLKLSRTELCRASLLVQELRAIASTNAKLRRLDFTDSIRTKPSEAYDDADENSKDRGGGVAEALFPLCRHQSTNVDWIILNGAILSDLDLDYLVSAAVDRNCHLRALELSRCGLNDRSLGMILDALRAHDSTLEALDISGNVARLSPNVFDSQISVFGIIRSLNLSYLSRTSGPEPLLQFETLQAWRLESLTLSGTSLNERTVHELAKYLHSPRSNTLRELKLDNSYLSGQDIATLMEAMSAERDAPRSLHLDISHNNIYRDHDRLCAAFAAGQSPTHVTLRAMEYRDESVLRHLLNAVRENHTTVYLDISRSSAAGDASEETTLALSRLFAENDTLEHLDISGEDSRLETSKFGHGLYTALQGLKHNKMLKVLRVEYQKLGMVGAAALAEVLKENETLRELHCANNELPLSALTDLVNALVKNTTLLFLPMMQESRDQALQHTEKQVKQLRDEANIVNTSQGSPISKTSSFGMRRGIASVKRNVTRTAAPPPSFPSLASSRTDVGSPPKSPSFRLAASPSSTAAPLPHLSDQDVIAALRLVAESWDRQQYRLQQYLERNWCIAQGIEAPIVQDEDFERPGSVHSLAGVLQQVKIDSTPTVERSGLDFHVDAPHGHDRGLSVDSDLDRKLAHAIVPDSPQLQLEIDTTPLFMGSPETYIPEEEEAMSPEEDEGLHMGLGIARTPTKTQFAAEHRE